MSAALSTSDRVASCSGDPAPTRTQVASAMFMALPGTTLSDSGMTGAEGRIDTVGS